MELLTQILIHYQPDFNSKQFHADLHPLEHWPDKLECCLTRTGLNGAQLEELRDAIDACHWRLDAGWRYRPSEDAVFQGRVLVVAAESGFFRQYRPLQYGFTKITKGRTDIEDVPGDHMSFIQGSHNSGRVVNVIERWLEPLGV
ncbi:uncharacterized protein [Anabrus simplex]|uniref:uncharacterized protein n=1 Tax=Anabrus simplex TaxID=316456 RepID=UPI0035A2D62D